MCGILGIVDKKGVDEQPLKKMRDTMVHRGPDDAGIWISRNRQIGLAHRRLSIIDLSEAGRQPMSDSEGNIWITFNGEIYNYKEIQEDLKEKGYTFESRSDTEVIINAYKEWGTDCLHKFNGMFAFGIYDDNAKIIFLARDRLGKKPLYYIHDKKNNIFAFASEIKALLKDKNTSREIDFQALNFYFTFGYIPGELCIFKEIRKLPPAHAMIYYLSSGEKKMWRYWDVPHLTEKRADEHEIEEELEGLLKDAVRIRLISDVPLGAFLSGGVDSSIVVAMMSMVSDKPVKTFSIGFEDIAFNELPYAKIVSEYFGTEHHELIVKQDAFSILPELVRQFDEPFADSSMIPTYYVSKATREHVTVALSGDGGDEIFGGYKVYLASLFDYYARMLMPLFMRKELAHAAECFPNRFAAKIMKQLSLLHYDLYDVFIERSVYPYFRKELRNHILSEGILNSLNKQFLAPELSRRRYLEQGGRDFINNLTCTDFKTYLPDDVMVKVDRMSMLASLETRAPIMDYRIAEYSFKHIPGNLKVKGVTPKYILKKLAKKILPGKLDINRKMGFAIPIADWFKEPLGPQIKEVLLDAKHSYFNQRNIMKLLDEHGAGIDHSHRLFALLSYFLWEREYVN